ncbi:MAG: CBS domain-containing protein [Desulfovibrio sp.]|uniref:CBS domain-containing protein n=1 Tax=Desulfovibrio sp. 7SRBS1 TaxID=3378064 RepID=UPI003B40E060
MNSKINVLLVDSEAASCTHTIKALAQEGFDVDSVASCEDALMRLGVREPDVMVLDPEADASEESQSILQTIRHNHPMVAVIILSGQADAACVLDAAYEGVFDYLAKPCDMPYLVSRIQDAYTAVANGLGWMGEKQAADLMVPLREYRSVCLNTSVRDAFSIMLGKNNDGTSYLNPSRDIRSLLVLDDEQKIQGYITYHELLAAVNKSHGSKQRPQNQDTARWEKYFWRGLFTRQLGNIMDSPVEELMSTYKATVDAGCSLQEVSEIMLSGNLARVLVKENGRCVGIIRDHELLAEIEEIFLASHSN